MLPLLMLLAAWFPQPTGSNAGLRGLKALPDGVVWASGTKGTFLLSLDSGKTWQSGHVPGAESLDFRAVEALDANTAWLMSAGEGVKSRIYRTSDSGKTWTLQFTNPDGKGFWDGLRFWDARHGILLGDPVDGHFTVFTTADGGATWQRKQTPPALPQEGAFAASNTSLALHGRSEVWFGTGGPGGARVFHSTNGGTTWNVAATPVRNGAASQGIFSLCFLSAKDGIAVGGDYVKPGEATHNIAITKDGGYTWSEPSTRPGGYRSGIAFASGSRMLVAVGTNGSDVSMDYGKTWKPVDGHGFNVVAFVPDGKGPGGGWAAGTEGQIAMWGQ